MSLYERHPTLCKVGITALLTAAALATCAAPLHGVTYSPSSLDARVADSRHEMIVSLDSEEGQAYVKMRTRLLRSRNPEAVLQGLIRTNEVKAFEERLEKDWKSYLPMGPEFLKEAAPYKQSGFDIIRVGF